MIDLTKQLEKQNKQETNANSVLSKPKYDTTKYAGYIESLMDIQKDKEIKTITPSPIMTPANVDYYRIQNRWDNIDNKSNTNSSSLKNSPLSAMDMSYDGDYLTANAYRISQQGDTINKKSFKKRAYSGRSVGKDGNNNPLFDFSNEAQLKEGEGPIPEGDYYINPQNIQRYEPTNYEEVGNIVAGAINSYIIDPIGVKRIGNRPGGKYSWGAGLIDIIPESTNTTKRGGFTIHGGEEPGSAGCIDMLDNDDELFKFIEQNRENLTNVPLKVNYSKKKE